MWCFWWCWYLRSNLEEKLKKGIDSACKDKTILSKSNSYLKKDNKVTEENTTINKNVVEPQLQDLCSFYYIAFLENREGVLEERVAELSSRNLSTFQNNEYSNKIQSAYEDILCSGVSSQNVEAVQIVLEKPAGITCDQLPKATFSKNMLHEAPALAQFQVASELNCSDADFCFQSNGTSKKGHLHMTYDASKKSFNKKFNV